MARIKHFAVALVFAACATTVPANMANAANTAEKTAATASTKAVLVTREKRAFEAWKTKDAKFWNAFLSDKFVGWGSFGKLDKASAVKEYTGSDCDVTSYALSDERMHPLGKGAALLTYKASVDATCGGQKLPANNREASIYIDDGGTWKGIFHAEAPVVDPKSVSAKPVASNKAPAEDRAQSAGQDARTDAMLAAERAVWEAWRAHDTGKMAALTAPDISFINIFGAYFPTKAAALKNWSGTSCDVKSISISDATGTMISPRVGILRFRASADGTCYGQKVGPIWGTSVCVRHDGVWKWTFGINLPASSKS